ncbi:MAG: chorismate synthase [Candidatus Omnitrophota bacterium]|nr:chorismate synthase [Candidatus Omnitrophota bacterium]
MLSYITTGESHGKHLAVILQGMPSGLPMDLNYVNEALRCRQSGYGRGGRQKIEKDTVEILGGIIKGKTTGAPIGLLLTNRDFKIDRMPELTRPRPGHADLVGALKYEQGIRAVLERSSARETAMRVAVGSICELLLKEFGMDVASHVVRIGPAGAKVPDMSVAEIRRKIRNSPVYCVSPKASKEMVSVIDKARRNKDSVGGQFEVCISGVPIGLGTHVHHERKLDGRIAQHVMSMQSVKAVEIGAGTRLGEVFGSEAHDEIFYTKKLGYYHKTNRAGGIEGGTSNGSDIVVRVTMKPISTLARPLASVDMKTKRVAKADFERSDTCAVPAGSLIGRTLVSYVIADGFLEKFGGDSVSEIRRNLRSYLKQCHA